MIVLKNDIDEAQNIAQRYKAEINIKQQFHDNGDFRIPYFIRQLGHIGFISTKIEYADYAVAQSIDSCISGWINTLKNRDAPKIVKWLFKREEFFHTYTDSAVRSSAFLAGSIYIANNVQTLSASKAVSLALFSLAIGFLSFTIVSNLTNIFYGQMRKFAPSTTLLITRGDTDEFDKIKKQKKTVIATLSVVFISVVLAFIVSFSAAFIYDYFLSE